MKTSVSFLLALGQLAAVGHTLDTRADVEVQCFALDPPVDEHASTYNSYGSCSSDCVDEGHSVFAARGIGCFCLDSLPSDDKKADSSKCNEPCPGYPSDICGGVATGYYTVGRTWSGSSNTTNTTSTPSESVSATITLTATATPSPSGAHSNSTISVGSPSSSTSGSSASSSSTVESSSAAASVFETSLAVVSSFVCTVALLAALI